MSTIPERPSRKGWVGNQISERITLVSSEELRSSEWSGGRKLGLSVMLWPPQSAVLDLGPSLQWMLELPQNVKQVALRHSF